jgi:hypothetical protein
MMFSQGHSVSRITGFASPSVLRWALRKWLVASAFLLCLLGVVGSSPIKLGHASGSSNVPGLDDRNEPIPSGLPVDMRNRLIRQWAATEPATTGIS